MSLDRDAVWAVIDEQRGSLADLLADLSPDEWAHPSLCRGWRVRDVAAHVTFSVARPVELIGPALRGRGDFHRTTHDAAVRRAAATSTGELVAAIRAMVGSRRRVPGLTPYEPLIDVLVHGQDIAVPLGRPRPAPIEAAATAATRIWSMTWPFTIVFDARRRLAGLRLVATDTEWSAGEGALVEGPVEALLLLLTGRAAVAVDRLSGPGVERLSPAPR
ncbi:maleylpyruvate isomerase family mycothiol-dependent enzyme [Geodermatophilus sp. SYSU D00691]